MNMSPNHSPATMASPASAILSPESGMLYRAMLAASENYAVSLCDLGYFANPANQK